LAAFEWIVGHPSTTLGTVGESELPDAPSSSSYPDGHIDDLAAQVGNVLANVFGSELVCRTVEILRQHTPMSSEHGCERLSHDQPIVFFRP
jgi:hypothetical protein